MAKEERKERILVIVESPNKVKTIKQFLPSNYVVMASVGHITKINDTGDYNMGIDVKNNFKADYVIDPSKKDVVSKLKEQVKAADKVILMADPDREGEAIAYHLFTSLKIPKSKCYRTTVHEITKSAVLKAIQNTRDIDFDLVSAATTRQKEDKIIGYRLSTVARNNVGARSVGRCQSPGLGLIVDLEEEIQNFKSETYYDFYLHFKKNLVEFKAKYQSKTKLSSLDQCKKIADECKKGKYLIKDIVKKDSLENPKAPFTTSTFQQEVSKKLGITIKDAMDCAQKLFEGVDIGGKHVALITYIRTDDANFAPEFLPVLKDYVENMYGKNYYAPVKAAKKGENAQEGHEAIRAIDLNMTPKALSAHISNARLLKVYEIIWKRTIAAAMKPAIFANTTYTIENGKHEFVMNSKELRFDGYRKVYEYGSDEKDEDNTIVKESFDKGEELKDTSLEAMEKHTNPPSRYNEASFVKELDKKGIGRPSTYASILAVILDEKRGYTRVEDKQIIPTDLGIKLWHYLKDHFADNVSIETTAEMEKELDLIANGKKDALDVLNNFYNKLCESIKKVSPDEGVEKVCPKCGKPLKIRKGRYGMFWGCTGYPECNYLENCKKK